VYDYITANKQLFKINSQVRDYDIIYGKLEKYSSEPVYTELTEALKKGGMQNLQEILHYH
jgi:hypothetical protein